MLEVELLNDARDIAQSKAVPPSMRHLLHRHPVHCLVPDLQSTANVAGPNAPAGSSIPPRAEGDSTDSPPLGRVVVGGVADVDIAAARPLGGVSLVAEDNREKARKEAVELLVRGRGAALAKGGREAAIAP